MTWQDIKHRFVSALHEVSDEREATQWFWLWLNHLKGWNRVQYELHRTEEIDVVSQRNLSTFLNRLVAGEPIQHVLGVVEFAGVSIAVNPHVLIPRPETEEMVERISNEFNGGQLLDLCSGSGCIAISLAKRFPDAKCFAVELSEEALNCARANGEQNNVQVEWIQGDVLADPMELPEMDLIVSNPPYIHPSESSEMEARVLDYDPKMALFVTNGDVLQFYKQLYVWVEKLLKPGGAFWFETHRLYAEETADLFRENPNYCDIEVIEDFVGNPRFVRGKKVLNLDTHFELNDLLNIQRTFSFVFKRNRH